MTGSPGGRDVQGATFEITHASDPSSVLIAGFTQFGLAGLSAADYLTDRLTLEPEGHIAAKGVPTVTPFEDGRPRHHTRIYSRPDLDVSVLVGEFPIPVWAAESFGDAFFEWVRATRVSEVVTLAGVPVAHGPDDHRTFYVATDDYRERRLDDQSIPAMGSGFLDGVNGQLLEGGIESDVAVGGLVTPVHALAPDVEASLRLVESVDGIYGLSVDTGPLQSFAEEVADYYSELQKRMEAERGRERPTVPEDRMYM